MTSEELRSYHRDDWQVEVDWLREQMKKLQSQIQELAKCKDCQEEMTRGWSSVWG